MLNCLKERLEYKTTISPSYFEDKSVQDDTKAVGKWMAL